MDLVLESFNEMELVERRLLAEAFPPPAQARPEPGPVLVFGFGSVVRHAAGCSPPASPCAGIFSTGSRPRPNADRFFSLSLDLLCISSADGYFKRVSPAVTDHFGLDGCRSSWARPLTSSWSIRTTSPATLREGGAPDPPPAKRVLQFEKSLPAQGRLVAACWSWRSVPQPDGLMYAIARDVTEQKKSEEQIANSTPTSTSGRPSWEATNKELEAFSYSVVARSPRPRCGMSTAFASLLHKNSAAALDDQGRPLPGRTISDSARKMGPAD